ncbi:two-component system sensor histidine kinase NtrB [Parvibium lacunae]|uniref:histidine kinase n=1 Tax=Parvibium lacunae TaxID=1888893 RepID=A0A368L1Y5_9BURK|nr:histidine kinase dimerization/phospho-acceptor domain-containing protein [Parvibium lacunae]RCS57451.1 hypothetical protein DU000_08310 [Parvibium lacunae]
MPFFRVANLNLDQPSQTVWTALRFFTGTRLAVALGLLLSFVSTDSKTYDAVSREWLLGVLLGYVLFAALLIPLAFKLRRRFYSLLVGQVALDLVVLGWLVASTEGLRSGLGLLFLLPVAGTAALSPLLLAFTVAAICSLGVLLDAWLRIFSGLYSDPLYSLAGLNGILFFVTAWFVNRVAARLIDQETLVREREASIQNQLAVNQLMVAEMQDGVVVVSAQGTIQTANPAALQILLAPTVNALGSLSRWQTLWATCQSHLQHSAGGARLDAPSTFRADAIIDFADEVSYAQRVQLRIHPVPIDRTLRKVLPPAETASLVLILQDLSEIETRAQQLKLASLGRLSASIAHEIRNPLSAIRHASALLAEDSQSETQRRLTRIVELNSVRINRIIEDVLSISRREPTQQQTLTLAVTLHELYEEFLEQMALQYGKPDAASAGKTPLAQRCRLEILVPPVLKIRFDSGHLRRVLFNLLNNAVRYASTEVGSIVLYAGPANSMDSPALTTSWQELLIVVSNDGPPLTAEQQQHLFEPFFTTDLHGTGLGLFLSRELCEANLATLSYLPDTPWHSQARVAFAVRVQTSMA